MFIIAKIQKLNNMFFFFIILFLMRNNKTRRILLVSNQFGPKHDNEQRVQKDQGHGDPMSNFHVSMRPNRMQMPQRESNQGRNYDHAIGLRPEKSLSQFWGMRKITRTRPFA